MADERVTLKIKVRGANPPGRTVGHRTAHKDRMLHMRANRRDNRPPLDAYVLKRVEVAAQMGRDNSCCCVYVPAAVQYEKSSHDVDLRLSSSAALLQTKLYLATKVLPTRQKIAGFKGFAGGFSPVCIVCVSHLCWGCVPFLPDGSACLAQQHPPTRAALDAVAALRLSKTYALSGSEDCSVGPPTIGPVIA